MTTLKMRQVFTRRRARSSKPTSPKPQVVITGTLVSKRYRQGFLLLDIASLEGGERMLCYGKGKKLLYNFYYLHEGDKVSIVLAGPPEGKLARMRGTFLSGLSVEEESERQAHAQFEYDSLIE